MLHCTETAMAGVPDTRAGRACRQAGTPLPFRVAPRCPAVPCRVAAAGRPGGLRGRCCRQQTPATTARAGRCAVRPGRCSMTADAVPVSGARVRAPVHCRQLRNFCHICV